MGLQKHMTLKRTQLLKQPNNFVSESVYEFFNTILDFKRILDSKWNKLNVDMLPSVWVNWQIIKRQIKLNLKRVIRWNVYIVICVEQFVDKLLVKAINLLFLKQLRFQSRNKVKRTLGG